MASDFTMSLERAGAILTLSCTGELDIATASGVEDAVRRALADPAEVLTLDWTGLSFMDSSGIRLLFRIVKLCKGLAIDLTWRLSPAAQRALDAVGIHDDLLRDIGADDDVW